MKKILIIEASDSYARMMSGLVSRAGYNPILAEDMGTAKKEVIKLSPGAVIIAAMKFRGGTAREYIDWLKSEGYQHPVVAVVDNLIPMELINLMCDWGAVNILQRQALDKQLVDMVGRYTNTDKAAIFENTLIRRQSADFREIELSIEKIAATDSNAIIFGEIGMGKEQVARQICKQSSRYSKPVKVVEAGGAAHIGDHDPTSNKSETYNRIKGYFNNASGGTIILKNIELLNFDKQSILLHILEAEHPNVRVICTADPHLPQMVKDKEFRANLFFLLRASDIRILPLRDVTEDIDGLADFFLSCHAKDNGEPKKHLDASALKALKLHQWPGNIRELRNVIILAACNTEGDTISENDLDISVFSPEMTVSSLLNDPKMEKQRIIEVLAKTQGNKTQACKLLGIARSTLDSKLKKHGLK
ncbi:MAG: sigma-54-dependent Fis family transcriptional regulator [Lachnospiraceae bacterium]|nr:sigma-54-dependent Fis family transcriptional regulator [Lachnospiraceae bacterium]